MRLMTSTILATLVVLLSCALYVRAELISEQEALTIARNYVSFILTNEGNWDGSENAEIASIQEFKRGDRILGYFCRVRPRGFLILSLHKELAPIRAYSGRCDLNPEAEEGLTGLIKDKMEGILDGVEQRLGRPLRPDDQIGGLLEINYRTASDVLVSDVFDPMEHREPRRSRDGAGMDYQEGEVMLTSVWHQGPPYNDQCPGMSCDWSAFGHFNYSAVTGCVATAGAQVMYYWRWPEQGAGSEPFTDAYDWPNVCDMYIYDGAGWFYNEDDESVTWAQISAVAELCSEVGIAVGMDYACDGSGAPTAYLEDAFEDHFRYSIDGAVIYRDDYDNAVDWFNELRNQMNCNRPVPYRIEGHAIVADGWKEEWLGDDYYWYHINYGWAGSLPDDPNWPGYPNSNTWFPLDELYHGSEDDYAIANVFPDTAISYVMGSYYPGGVRRYFDRDVRGTNAYFSAGQDLQILRPGFHLWNNGDPTDAIRFNGEPDAVIRFFLEGDLAGMTRIRVQGGAMKIHGAGEMVVR